MENVPVTDDEYREFLTFLLERYVRPRLARVRRRFHHHMMEEWDYHLNQAQQALQVLRFIEANCNDDDEIYHTFTLERLMRAVSDTRYSLEFANRMAGEAGFLDALEAHADDILSGLRVQDLPDADRQIFREMGSPNPELELRALVLRAKAFRDRLRQDSRELPIGRQLKHAEQRVAEAQQSFEKMCKAQEEELADKKAPAKSRRWFKGLGQIAQGAALSIADVALAVGALHFPVSPETQTWGAVASVTTGIGTILNGVGDLRNE
jgi:hypothetical protein